MAGLETIFTGKLTGWHHQIIRKDGETIRGIKYEWEVTTNENEKAYLLFPKFYAEIDLRLKPPPKTLLGPVPGLGTEVKGTFRHWKKEDINYVTSIQLKDFEQLALGRTNGRKQ